MFRLPGRQPAPDRPGPVAHPPGRGRLAEAVPARAGDAPSPDEQRDEDRLEIDALLRNIKSSFQKVVSLSPLLSDDLQTLAHQHRGAGAPRRLHRVEPEHHRHADQAGGARHARRPRPDGQPEPDPHQGARGPRARIEDPVAGAVGGRQEPARLLPARAAEGDPEGAGRRRRPAEGDRGASREDRRRGDARGRQEGGHARARAAVADAGGRGRIHGLADLPRLARRAARGTSGPRKSSTSRGPSASSTRSTPGSRRRRTASSSTSPCAS